MAQGFWRQIQQLQEKQYKCHDRDNPPAGLELVLHSLQPGPVVVGRQPGLLGPGARIGYPGNTRLVEDPLGTLDLAGADPASNSSAALHNFGLAIGFSL